MRPTGDWNKSHSRREFLKLWGVGSLWYGIFAGLVSTHAFSLSTRKNKSNISQQPNFIIVFTDDQGFGDVEYTGNQVIETPNIDRFAKNNIEFNQFYVSPVCTPTRVSLLTGRYSQRSSVQWVG